MMNCKKTIITAIAAAALGIGVVNILAGRALGASTATPLNQQGQTLLGKYSAELANLRTQIRQALPTVGEQQQSAYFADRRAEENAAAALKAAQDQINKIIGKPQAMIAYVNAGWLPRNRQQMAAAQAALRKAKTDAERAAAQKRIAWCQADREKGIEARQKCEQELALAKQRDEPKLLAARDAAVKALAEAKARTMRLINSLNVNAFVSSDKLDAQLAKFEVLFWATPKGLAEFAQQGAEQAALLQKLLADEPLMMQMVYADGAAGGKYGRAMEIYTAIQRASAKARAGVLQRLAVAIALEHAVPIRQSNPKNEANAPATVDPVLRYLDYEKAYLAGDLDPQFQNLTTWDLRFVVNGDEPDATADWGRAMLRNYRPDIILNSDYRWRYVQSVRTDVHYGSQNVKYDQPYLQNYQNIIMNGGVCGRRAWFGGFILRSFGIPTVRRPQPGHAALVHWTPQGWVPCLGGGWGSGWTVTRYKGDRDFLATTQARENKNAYLQVKRAQWAGDVMGEKPIYGFSCGEPGLWYGISLYRQKEIIAQSNIRTIAAVGTSLGEANESLQTRAQAVAKAPVTAADREVMVAPNGVITVPAAACRGRLSQMKSFLGGLQAFCSGTFTCNVQVPSPGTYQVSARIVTVHRQGKLKLTADRATANMTIPYTTGQWQVAGPVEVNLVAGKNVLTFANPTTVFALKDITLTPVR